MEKLIKCSSGLLYKEDFGGSIGLIWDLAPNKPDRVDVTSNSIRLMPGGDRLELTMPCPQQNEWVFQTHINYRPKAVTESGGVVLKSTTDNVIECEFNGDTSDTYSYMKTSFSNYIFSLKASKDGTTWFDFGNTVAINSNKFGYYLSDYTQQDTLEVYNAVVCKNNFIMISVDNSVDIVDIYDINNNKITNKFMMANNGGSIIVDCSNSLFPISYLKFSFKGKDGNELFQSYAEDIYGGDTYSTQDMMKFEINDVSVDEEFDIGSISDNTTYKLTITNLCSYELVNKRISVTSYSPYNPGDIPVSIADVVQGDESNFVFKKEVLASFEPYGVKTFCLKINRSRVVIFDKKYKFKIVLY